MKFLKYTALALSIVAGSANAALVEKDWLSGGDGLSTLDTNTGLEWLDLTVTDSMSINEVAGKLGKGELFEGWRLASAYEVNELIRSFFGVDYEDGGGVLNASRHASSEQVDTWQYHFGITGPDGRSMGRYDNGLNTSAMAGSRDSGTVYINYGRGG